MPLLLIRVRETTLDLKFNDLRVSRCSCPWLPSLYIAIALVGVEGSLRLLTVIEGVRDGHASTLKETLLRYSKSKLSWIATFPGLILAIRQTISAEL